MVNRREPTTISGIKPLPSFISWISVILAGFLTIKFVTAMKHKNSYWGVLYLRPNNYLHHFGLMNIIYSQYGHIKSYSTHFCKKCVLNDSLWSFRNQVSMGYGSQRSRAIHLFRTRDRPTWSSLDTVVFSTCNTCIFCNTNQGDCKTVSSGERCTVSGIISVEVVHVFWH